MEMNEPLALCNLVIVALTAYVTYQGFEQVTFRDKLIFEPVRILRGKQYYRIVSSGFIHADWNHFLFNMFSLYSFGSSIEIFLGVQTFLFIYFAGIIGGNLLSLYLHRNHNYRALGASGGVCGVIFASIFLYPGGKINIFFIPIGIPASVYAILFLIFSFIGMRAQLGNVGHDAHLGGALIGLLTATILHPYILRLSPVLYLSVILITGALFLYAYKHPAYPQIHLPLSRTHREQAGRDLKNDLQKAKHGDNEQTLDGLLDKISKEGIHSLTMSEIKKLRSLSQNRNSSGR
ncbi:MAG: rhomboid family intramembrane serine protease [Chlorobaculum sp.]|nr:rhomboid family intramembrane serine protease [Chlorobaculum sp.]